MSSSKHGTEKMRVDGGGNVGIGTSSPASKLHVADGGSTVQSKDANGYARVTQQNGSAQLGLFRSGASAGGGYIGGNSDASFIVMNDSFTERMRINSSGKVGIGTSSPTADLHVEANGSNIARFGDDFGNNVALTIENDTGIAKIRYDQASDGTANKHLGFFAGSSEAMRIDSSGKVGIGTTTPTDAKLHVDVGSTGGVRIEGDSWCRLQLRHNTGHKGLTHDSLGLGVYDWDNAKYMAQFTEEDANHHSFKLNQGTHFNQLCENNSSAHNGFRRHVIRVTAVLGRNYYYYAY